MSAGSPSCKCPRIDGYVVISRYCLHHDEARARRESVTEEVTETSPDPEAVELACAWSDFRKDYAVSPDADVLHREHRAFKAGWAAARGALDLGGVQR